MKETISERPETWFAECVEKIKEKYKRSPRNTWDYLTKSYNEKTNLTIDITTLKRIINRTKMIEKEEKKINLPEISNIRLYEEIRKEMLKTHEEMTYKETENRTRTQKINPNKIKTDIIEYINIVIEQEKMLEKIKTLSDYSKLVYTTQIVYENIVKAHQKGINWKEAMEKKIEKTANTIKELTESKESQSINEEALQACRKEKIHSNNAQQVNILINKYQEQEKSLMRGLEVKVNKQKYNKENALFEWNRKRFYRSLESKKSKIEENLTNKTIMEYWGNIYKKKFICEEYEFLENLSMEKKIAVEWDDSRISYEVEQAIKYCDNWKTPGPDQIYNFFIKKIKVLHGKLSELIKNAIHDPNKIPSEMYRGTT
ncbi:hypothetical protein ENBRE01_0391 [Enteropsectra breve]|nr:hypothetical protein ENBRE01_0391 [Enteropsectra breve]